MRKLNAAFVLLVVSLLAAPAFAHGGKTHRLMGTVKEVQPQGLIVTTADGHEMTVAVSDQTKYEQDGKPAAKTAVVVGGRVSIQLSEDNKSALNVKLAPTHQGH